MKVGLRTSQGVAFPGRALVLGLPLTLLVTAVAGPFVVGLPWLQSLPIGAVLAPTDPVFAAAIVGRKGVPARLRHLLNVESGLNDGLALPVVLVLLALGGGTDVGIGVLTEEIALGLLVGVLVPLIVIWLERLPFLMATKGLQPLVAVSIGLLVLAICLVTGRTSSSQRSRPVSRSPPRDRASGRNSSSSGSWCQNC